MARKKSAVIHRMHTCFSHPTRTAMYWLYKVKYAGKWIVSAGWCAECFDNGEPEVLISAHETKNGFGRLARMDTVVVGHLAKFR